ncbi:DNA-directed RNA polymerase subunit M [Haloprofundus marisrubri]|uniref:Transcription factor S n=1 Tax=Haloprofundus marisrubri TaxID=1514971 RepID=A0A0W1RA10_9EURY|nr:transcription factor S [Haloprofundus marisrubri]KTG10215.1 DNA-directed RNA polymerase subunit M [Haloprofundus marisrubri]
MEFCDECGSMMQTQGDKWVCTKCDHEKLRDEAKEKAMVTTQAQEESEVIESEGGTSGLPTTTTQCPNCDNDTAYWYMQQIRSADESETRFFVCTECEHKWREDDH